MKLQDNEGITFIEHDTAKEAGKLISKDYGLPEGIRNHVKEIDKALAHIRICDPAIGSGAFPVGMMNEIVKFEDNFMLYADGVDTVKPMYSSDRSLCETSNFKERSTLLLRST